MNKDLVFVVPTAGERDLIAGRVKDFVFKAECVNNGDCWDCASCDCTQGCDDCACIDTGDCVCH